MLVRAAGTADEMRLTADWLSFSVTDQKVKARGHVFLDTGEEKIRAEEVEISLEDEKGVLRQTSIKIPGNSLTFLGDTVRKTGPYAYSFENGFVTACPFKEGKSPPWSIHATDTKLTVEGYASLWNTTFCIKNVPVLYSPYLLLPAKTVRQTGFLFPELSHSDRDGLGLIAPFFINLSASSDLTLYPGYLDKRGGFAGAEFRYVAGPESAGTFMVNYLDDSHRDSASDDFNDDGYYRQTRNRYWLRAKADQRISDTTAAKFDLDVVSDRDYLQEYRDGIVGFDQSNENFFKNYHRDLQEASIPFRQSSLQVTKTRK
ncbi:MAG: LPS assembly protein LptD, partial [Deltaproteobacteria bacterium]